MSYIAIVVSTGASAVVREAENGPGSPGYIDSLTALRGIAALWVVIYHFDSVIDPLAPGETGLVNRAYLWVDFFFVLSGFVLCHVYGDRFAGGPSRREFRRYLTARFSRIYPLHLFTLLLMVGLWTIVSAAAPAVRGTGVSQLFDPATIPQNLALVHAASTTEGLTWNAPSWSISAEWWTYIVAAILLPLIHLGRRWRAWAAVAASVAGLAILESLHPKGSLVITADLGVIRCLFGFTLGVGAYQLYRTGFGASILHRDTAFAVVSVATVALLHRSPADVLILPVFAALVLVAARNDGRMRPLLNARPMRYLGDISYSIYMMQAFWLVLLWTFLLLRTGMADAMGNFGTSPLERLALLLLVLTLIVGSSALTYRFVERPARTWIRRVAARPRR